jgi:hypothetical protein
MLMFTNTASKHPPYGQQGSLNRGRQRPIISVKSWQPWWSGKRRMKRLEYQSRIFLMGSSILSQRRRFMQTIYISLPIITSLGRM